MKKRLFVAINFDPATRLAIARQTAGFPDRPGLNKIRVDNLHLTLLFLGDTDEELIPEISRQLDDISKNFRSLILKFGRLGGFPDLKYPQVVWVGIEGPNLIELRQTIAQLLLPLVPTADTKPFHPHLTLARVSSSTHPELTAILDSQGQRPPFETNLPSTTISHIHLI